MLAASKWGWAFSPFCLEKFEAHLHKLLESKLTWKNTIESYLHCTVCTDNVHSYRANKNMTGQKMVLAPDMIVMPLKLIFLLGWLCQSSVGDPDPYVSGPPGSGSKRYESGSSVIKKNSEKNLDSYYFVTSLWFYIYDKNVPVASKSKNEKKFFCCRLRGYWRK